MTVTDNAGTRRKVRLAAIDAPEARQAYGRESRQNLSAMVLGKAVRIEWRKQDRYGRIIGKLILLDPPCATCPQTRDAGLAQLEAGLAWWDREARRERADSAPGVAQEKPGGGQTDYGAPGVTRGFMNPSCP